MSALGDYIHLYKKNYLTYGVAEKGEKPKPYTPVKNLLTNRLKTVKPISPSALLELETRLKKNTKTQEKLDKNINEQDYQKKLNEMYKLIASYSTPEAWGHGIGRMVDHGKIKGPSNYYASLDATKTYGVIAEGKLARNNILTAIDRINKEGVATNEDIQNLLRLYKVASLGKDFSGGGGTSILGSLQRAANELTYNTYYTHVVGDVGEHLVAMCGDTAQNCAVEEIQEVLKQSVIGNTKSTVSFSKDLISKDLSKYISTDKSGNNYIIGHTQDKVDVQIKINNEDVYASVKNYGNPKDGKVTLQSDISLISTLAFLEQFNQFSTHWLNMHSGQMKGNVASANKTLKEEIAYEALVEGNPFKTGKKANVFIFMDYLSGKVYVKDVKTILTKEFNKIGFSPRIEGIKFTNTKVATHSRYNKNTGKRESYRVTYSDRITSILMQARAQQLRVTLNVSASK